MRQVTYLETGSTNPYYNLAFEEYVLQNRKDGDYLILWQNDNTIVVGQNQNTEAEINEEFVREHGIHVVRRSTGGGAVYHDLGNLNYSFITDLNDASTLTMDRFTDPIVGAMHQLGLRSEASGRNDILVEGKKVSGTAQRIAHGRILHHGTLLFDSSSDMISGALNVDPEKFKSKSAKSVKSRVGNIRSFLKEDMTLNQFWEYLKKALAGSGFVDGKLSDEELAAVEKLKEEKYDTWDWNYGKSPKCSRQNKRRWDGGTLEVRLSVEKGRISEIVFFGDFLAVRAMKPVTDALYGCPFDRQHVSEVLDRFPVSEYFGTITKEEILETVFD